MTKNRLVTVTGIIIAVLIVAVLLPGYTKLQDVIAENRTLEKRITDLGRSIEELRVEKEKLESDILYIEKVAREQLGVVREDEVVIKEERR